jgi:hypothetical protein
VSSSQVELSALVLSCSGLVTAVAFWLERSDPRRVLTLTWLGMDVISGGLLVTS